MGKLLAGKRVSPRSPGTRAGMRRFRLPRLWNLTPRLHQAGNAAISAIRVATASSLGTPAAAYPFLESCKTSRTIWLV
jgi:hypothetical protein